MYEKRKDIFLTIIPKIIKFSQVSIHEDSRLKLIYIYIVTDFGHRTEIMFDYDDFTSEEPDVILCDIITKFMNEIIDCYIDDTVYSVASTYLANKEVVEELSNAD